MSKPCRHIGATLVLGVLMTSLFLGGCVEKHVLERTGLIVAFGYDELPKDRILGTAVLYQIDPDAREKVNVIANTAYTSKGIRSAENAESAKKLASGQLRITVYHDPLARKGIINLVDTLSRDADIGTGVYLTVSKNKAFSILSHRFPEFANIGSYLYQSIKQNVRGERMVSSTLHEFFHDYYSIGKDPVLPYITRRGNEVMIDRIALFYDDRMVETMSLQEAFLIKLLRGRFRSGNLELSLPQEPLKKFLLNPSSAKEVHIVMEQISSNTKIKLLNASTPAFKVNITIEARLQEVSQQADLSKKGALAAMQTEINNKLESLMHTLLKETQKLRIDPVGFGEKYLSTVKNPSLTKDKWRNMYANATFSIEVDTILVRTGVTQ